MIAASIAELSRGASREAPVQRRADAGGCSTGSRSVNPQLNAFVTVEPSARSPTRRAADASDRRRRRRPAHRHPDRAQGRADDRGHAHDLRLADARELRRALRRARRRGPEARRHRARRQDEHGRVRDGLVERDLVLRPGEESLEPRVRAGRQLGRLGGGGRGAARRRRDRHRYRRLDPPARGALRHLRH